MMAIPLYLSPRNCKAPCRARATSTPFFRSTPATPLLRTRRFPSSPESHPPCGDSFRHPFLGQTGSSSRSPLRGSHPNSSTVFNHSASSCCTQLQHSFHCSYFPLTRHCISLSVFAYPVSYMLTTIQCIAHTSDGVTWTRDYPQPLTHRRF